jgi:hypothetical protein
LLFFQTLLDDTASGRSSIDSIEGSDLTNNSDLDDTEDDLDDADATNTLLGDRFSGGGADSFDTDEDDDENGDCSSDISTRDRRKHPQFLIKCLKDSIINSLASSLLQQFLNRQQPLLQRYAKHVCAKNSIKLRPKLRPSSLPPRSLSQNRLSLQIGASMTSTFQQHQIMITSLPFRSTPEPNIKLNSLLRVTPIRITNSVPITTASASPRKSQTQIPPPPPPPSTERMSTSSAIEKRNQQQISLIGTAVTNLPLQLTLSTPQPSSQTQMRQTPSMWRYRSATTITSNTQNFEPITRLPPITIERLISSDQLMINRSNTITAAIVESIPQPIRAVSGTSTGSNFSATAKLRTLTALGKLQRTSRPISISSNKDLNNSSSTSPARSITAAIPSTTLRTTAASRTLHHHHPQQHHKRPSISTKAPPPPPPSGAIKVPATHIY